MDKNGLIKLLKEKYYADKPFYCEFKDENTVVYLKFENKINYKFYGHYNNNPFWFDINNEKYVLGGYLCEFYKQKGLKFCEGETTIDQLSNPPIYLILTFLDENIQVYCK
jgi:hypothetical protein